MPSYQVPGELHRTSESFEICIDMVNVSALTCTRQKILLRNLSLRP